MLVQAGFGDYLTSGETPPEFDVHVSLMSLAGYLPDRSGQPYCPEPYLKANARLVEQWARRLKDVRGFRIGIAWAGNPDHSYDQFRSTRLANFAPLADIPGVQLISLQKGAGSEQLAELAGRHNVLDLDDEMDHEHGAFVDRAAVIENLDLVISVDTAVVHLAGALGRPAWVALQYVPDWRWRMEGETTPWYPSLRLFRRAGSTTGSRCLSASGRKLLARRPNTRRVAIDSCRLATRAR